LVERWTGRRLELALVSKFLVRHTLSTEPVTNLVHRDHHREPRRQSP
jgi:hypothetical protein